MLRKLLLVSAIAGSCLLPISTHAADEVTQTGAQSAPVTKDQWLESMLPMLPSLICKGFMDDAGLKKRFDELKMSYDDCVKLIPESSDLCKTQIYDSIPNEITEPVADEWGRKLGECIGGDFATKHLIPDAQ